MGSGPVIEPNTTPLRGPRWEVWITPWVAASSPSSPTSRRSRGPSGSVTGSVGVSDDRMCSGASGESGTSTVVTDDPQLRGRSPSSSGRASCVTSRTSIGPARAVRQPQAEGAESACTVADPKPHGSLLGDQCPRETAPCQSVGEGFLLQGRDPRSGTRHSVRVTCVGCVPRDLQDVATCGLLAVQPRARARDAAQQVRAAP